jgi:quercetin dioxygenase-like cupin family protein
MSEGEEGSAGQYFYDEWMAAKGLPVYRGHFVPDTRTIELAHWAERECDAAFIQLVGQEGVSEARITQIAPGQTLPPYRMAIDEIVYVISGSGQTRLWSQDSRPGDGHSFEWNERALFLVPAHESRQFANVSGDTPVRLLHYNYLPLAMSLIPDQDFFFANPYTRQAGRDDLRKAFSDAQLVNDGRNQWRPGAPKSAYWYGNFFPDMRSWDKLDSNASRGAGGKTVRIHFADSAMGCHMSVFDATTYKKAHRHGPGRVIVIPSGEGYSLLWGREGDERVVVPWQENALFVPPDRWFHQHFNLGRAKARYLALHPPRQFHGYAEDPRDRAKDQIEYPDEDAWIRERFEQELAARGLTSGMPKDSYASTADAWR